MRALGMQVVWASGLLFAILAEPAAGLNFNPTDANNIVADGYVSAGEWADADYEADAPGYSWGAMYAMQREGYEVGAGSYTGYFQFLCHNIERLKTEEYADYNVFDVYDQGNSANPRLRVFVFNDVDEVSDAGWLADTASGLGSLLGVSSLDDRGFLVCNLFEGGYRQWLPENVGPEDGSYDWDYYWGMYARGGYNNSAYEAGLDLAIDDDNEVYEVIYRSSDPVQSGGVRRSIKDPDSTPTSELVDYWDGLVTPEPSTLGLLMVGAAALLGRKS